MTSDTPRTDAHYGVLGIKQVRGTERDLFFARTLERELNEAKEGPHRAAIMWQESAHREKDRADAAEAKLAALQVKPDVAGLDVNKPVAMAVQADQDGSISNEIAPTAWSTYERELGNLKAHPWVLAGAAKIVPLYLHPQSDALRSLSAQLQEKEAEFAAFKAENTAKLAEIKRLLDERDGLKAECAGLKAEKKMLVDTILASGMSAEVLQQSLDSARKESK